MKLSEYKNEDAVNLLADLMEPLTEILSDAEFAKMLQNPKGFAKMDAIRYVMKKHPKAIVKMLAIMDGADVNNYEVGVVEIPMKMLELLNDPALARFFQSQGQTVVGVHSGSVTESTEETDEI